MPIRVFTLSFDPEKGFADDETVNRFLLSRRLNELRKEFFMVAGRPYWSILVDYEEMLPDSGKTQRNGLNEWQRILFQKLREWRKRKAEANGIPAYLVATDGELTRMVTDAPDSLEKIRSIHGFGSKKVEKYGKEIIAIIQDFFKQK